MNTRLKILFILLFGALMSCNKGKDTAAGDPVEDESNEALYSQVMDIHDEVMPKMDDLYKMKKGIQTKLADSVNLSAEQKSEMKQTILLLDSANNSMMVWMRQFNPPTDSTNEEALREYLETQLEMVKKMREDVLEAIEKGQQQSK